MKQAVQTKMKQPSLEDCQCPICLEILIEPVTMPCKHELCMPCFQKNVQEANFVCPVCRLRISSWARTAVRNRTLINQVRWRAIRHYYAKEVTARVSGGSGNCDSAIVIPPVHEICQPGEIRREYEEQIRKFQEQLRLEREQEEAASLLLIAKLQKIGAGNLKINDNVDNLQINEQGALIVSHKEASSSRTADHPKLNNKVETRSTTTSISKTTTTTSKPKTPSRSRRASDDVLNLSPRKKRYDLRK